MWWFYKGIELEGWENCDSEEGVEKLDGEKWGYGKVDWLIKELVVERFLWTCWCIR